MSLFPPARLAGALAAAWLFAVAAYLLHVAWLVPVVILLGAASLMPGRRGVLDRIVPAAALLYGAGCLLGLGLSVWPWHLHPVAVGGAGLSALVCVAALTGRRPVMLRPNGADALTLAGAGFVGAVAAFPLVGHGHETRLAILTAGEDGIRHFTMIEAIRQVGGYLFLHQDQAAGYVYTGMVHYPQGSHLLFAVLDGFVRSSATDLGSSLDALDHYLGYAVLSYASFALAVLWAVQRLAGPTLSPARRLVLVGAVMTYLLSTQAFVLVVLQYPPQILGLTLVALLVAVLARPPARPALSLGLVAALLVAVGFTYYLYLPAAGLAVLVWLFARRRVLARHRVAVAGTVLAGLAAAVPAVVGVAVARQDAALLVWAPRPALDGLLVAAGLAGAGLVRGWRVPRWRVVRWVLGAAVACLLALHVTQRALGGAGGSYYGNKTLDLVLLLLVLAGASLLGFLPVPAPTAASARARGHRLAVAAQGRSLLAAAAVLVALAGWAGLVAGDSPQQPSGSVIARAWLAGAYDYHRYAARTAIAELARTGLPPGTVTVVMRETPVQAYLTQVLLSAVLRQAGPTGPAIYPGTYDRPDRYDRMVEALRDRPVLIIVDTAQTAAAAEQVRRRHPDQDIRVAFMYAP